MHWRDILDSLRGKHPGGGGDGTCVTNTGQTLELELFKFDT